MAEQLIEDPCVVFALPRESMRFRKEYRPHRPFAGAPCWAKFCGTVGSSVLVLHAGMGKRAITRAGEWLLGGPRLGGAVYRPRLVVMAGYAGGLQDGLVAGDVVVATEVLDGAGQVWRTSWPEPAREPGLPSWLRRGRILTADGLVSSPEEKRRLGTKHGAAAVDMESAVLARLCAGRGVPFGCVRALSDGVDTPLPPRLATLFTGERLSLPRVALALLRQPALMADFWKLARQTRHASARLAQALGLLLAGERSE